MQILVFPLSWETFQRSTGLAERDVRRRTRRGVTFFTSARRVLCTRLRVQRMLTVWMTETCKVRGLIVARVYRLSSSCSPQSLQWNYSTYCAVVPLKRLVTLLAWEVHDGQQTQVQEHHSLVR